MPSFTLSLTETRARHQIRSALPFLLALTGSALAQDMPEPDPPILVPADPARLQTAPPGESSFAFVPTIEWTLHKSVDGTDPDGKEQRMVWLMNRARMNPTAEGIWLAESDHPDVANGRNFFGVDLNQLKADFATLEAKAPAAFDIRLHDASVLHSEDLIARDAQDHTGQVDRVIASGFSCVAGRFSVFSFADSALNAHAALNIDWGFGPGGVQDPPGHRLAIMGVLNNNVLSNVGLAMVPENNPMSQVGPEVFSGAYCQAGGSDHNRFIVGTVWDDTNLNGEYDENEGLENVMVMPDVGTYYAITGTAGGYSIPATAQGIYSVTYSGGDLGATVINKQVTVGLDSVLLDARPEDASPGIPLLLRRTTDNRWFAYHLSGTTVVDKGKMNMTRSPDYSVVSRGDFNGDGESDVLLRDLVGGENGRWVVYTMSGRTITSQGFVELTRNHDWVLVATDDFNGDGKADGLLRNAVDGRWLLYLLNGQQVLAQGIIAMTGDLTNSVIGTGDFDADGRSDMLLRTANGSWILYFLDGLNEPVVSGPTLTANVQFGLQALADFNGDNRIDVLLRRSDGRWFIYLMNGSSVLASGSPALSENTDFGLIAVDDFNNDDRADLLLRRSDGRWYLYVLDGLTVIDEGQPDITGNSDFSLVTTDDFDEDGNADVLLRRIDGRWVLYSMDGPDVIGASIPDMTRNTAWVPQVN